MSADDGTYILKTSDGSYRVTSRQAIENIYENWGTNRYDPLEVVLTWKDCRYTKDKLKAYQVAEAIERKWASEYGIKTFEYRKPWRYIIEDAKSEAKIKQQQLLELSKVRKLDYGENYDLEKANEVLNMNVK